MKNKNEHLEDISHIRSLMEQSSRFISLSGLSGVFTGVYAILGALAAHFFANIPFTKSHESIAELSAMPGDLLFLLILAVILLILSVSTAIWLTSRKARSKGLKVWNTPAKQLITSMAVPLFTGGLFCAGLIYHDLAVLTVSAMLIFYGLALINASKNTLYDIWYLGFLQCIIGILALLFPLYGLIFWTTGFGLLHIAYGIGMYYKYERNSTV